MSHFMKKIMLIVISCMVTASTLFYGAHVESQAIPGVKSVLVHTYGGSGGEFETDQDNSSGIWSYFYTADGTISSKQSLILNYD